MSQTTQKEASGLETDGFGYIPQQSNPSSTRNVNIRPLSITDFAPLNQQHHPTMYQPPTPPPDDDDNEAMDWTPSQEAKSLRPAVSYRTSIAVGQQPQSVAYRENLPADALRQAHSLRNPPIQPMFRKGSEIRNQESFKTPKKYAMRDSYNESPFATPYEPSIATDSPELSPMKFAQPRFFPHSDHEDLGLESLMANNFSLAEEPGEVRARQQRGKCNNEARSKLEDVYTQWNGPAALLLLTISCIVWTSRPIPTHTAFRMHFRLAALCIAAFVIIKSLFPALRKDSNQSLGDIVLLTFELITTLILGVALRQRATIPSLDGSIGPLETPGKILIAVLIAQEAWMLYSGTWVRRIGKGEAPSPPGPQPAAASDKPNLLRPIVGGSMTSSRQDHDVGTVTGSNGKRLPASSQRTTRSRTNLENDTRAPGGFGSLSLGGNARNQQVLGVNSLNLGQPQRRNGNGV